MRNYTFYWHCFVPRGGQGIKLTIISWPGRVYYIVDYRQLWLVNPPIQELWSIDWT